MPLDGVGRCRTAHAEQAREARQRSALADGAALLVQIQADFRNGLPGVLPGSVDVAVVRFVTEREVGFVRAEPVGQRAQTQEHVLEGGSGRERRRASIERSREPPAHQSADAPDAARGFEAPEGAPDLRIGLACTLELQRQAVVGERRHQEIADRLAVSVVPGREFAPAERGEEPRGGFGVDSGQNRCNVQRVAGPLDGAPALHIIGEPDLRLEAGVDFSDVVKRGEYAQPCDRCRIQVMQATRAGQAPSDSGLGQQCFQARPHIRQVMLQQVNALGTSLPVGVCLGPEPAKVGGRSDAGRNVHAHRRNPRCSLCRQLAVSCQ